MHDKAVRPHGRPLSFPEGSTSQPDTAGRPPSSIRGEEDSMVSENADRLAVLIDADNAQPAIAEGLLAEVAKYGTAHVKRAYGDWTGTSLKGWKDQLLAQSIQPIP